MLLLIVTPPPPGAYEADRAYEDDIAWEALWAQEAVPNRLPVKPAVAINEPVTSVFEFIETNVPVSVTLLLVICSPKSPLLPFVNLFVVIVIY